MTPTVPPHVQQSTAQLTSSLEAAGVKIDPATAKWAEIEKGVARVLKGPFRPEMPEHQVVALGLAGMLAERLTKEHHAFWFPNRDLPEGAGLGFGEAIMMLSPFSAVMEALSQAKLERLEEVQSEIRRALAEVKFAATTPASIPRRLTPVDYQRLFDPGFIQLLVLDRQKTQTAWDSPVSKLTRDLSDAITRVSAKMSKEAKDQLDGQLLSMLRRLDPTKKLLEQAQAAPRVGEFVAELFGTTDSTAAAPEEFWVDIALPLLHIGAPNTFPPLEPEDLKAVEEGLDPLLIFLDAVPFQIPAADEGLLGIFPVEELAPPHPALPQAASLRLVKVGKERLKPLFAEFDPAKTKAAIDRFRKYVTDQLGKSLPESQGGPQLVQNAMALLEDLKSVLAAATKGAQLDLCVRRLTEAEAASEGTLHEVRQALGAPRIILA